LEVEQPDYSATHLREFPRTSVITRVDLECKKSGTLPRTWRPIGLGLLLTINGVYLYRLQGGRRGANRGERVKVARAREYGRNIYTYININGRMFYYI